MTRVAVVVPFDDLAPLVDDWRERTCAAKPSHGVPPHVTLMLPAAPGSVRALEGFDTFDVTFASVGVFEGAVRTLWLAPEPDAPFRAMTEALVRAYPDHLPYGGAFADAIPHLTVAQDDIAAARAAVEAALPIRARATCVLVLEQDEPPAWREADRIELR